jgi:TetR/AcrR family transcriptional repressor of nem operon
MFGRINKNMARTKRTESDEIRGRLLDVGLKTFAHCGYHGTGIKEIVDGAGVPKGSFYNYFKSKEEFGIEVIRCHSIEFWETWTECFDPEGADPLKALLNCFDRMITEHAECTVHRCSIVGNLAAELCAQSLPCQSTLQAVVDDWGAKLAAQLLRAQEQGLARTDLSDKELATLFWDIWHGTLHRVKIVGSTEPLKQSVTFCLLKMFRK